MIVHGFIHGDDSLSVTPIDNPQYALLTEGGEKIWEYEADTWEDCMRAWHEFNGWEPYVPF